MVLKRYERGYSFAGYQATTPNRPLPGNALDNELENIEQSLDGAISGLNDIRREDGALRNGVVTKEALAPGLSTGVDPATQWTTGIAYVPNNVVFYDAAFYRCLSAHVSDVFIVDLGADRWEQFADFTPYFTDVETWRDEAVAAAGAATTAASTATTQAGVATTSASTATAAGVTATTQAGIATAAASTATTQAGIAVAAAVDAAASASSINVPATDAAQMIAQLATGASVELAATLTSVTVPAGDVPVLLSNFHKLRAHETTTLNLPSLLFTISSGSFMRISAANSNLRLVGATPVETKATSVASVAGSAGNWLVTYNVNSSAGFVVGRYAKLFDAAPLPVLSGDNVASYVLRDYPVLGELCVPITNTGAASVTSGGNTVVFAGGLGTLSNTVKVGNLITIMGQSLEVTAVNAGTRTATVNGTWSRSVSGTGAIYVSRRANGVVSTSGSSQTVTGTGGSIFTTQAEVGSLFLAAGELAKVTAIASDTSLTLDKPVTFSAGTPFSFLHPLACIHEGLREVTAIPSSTQVTLRVRSFAKPPIVGVSVDEFKAINTVFENTGTGDGVVFEQNGAIREIDNIAFVSARASSGSVGFLLQNRIESEIAGDGSTSFGDFTQHGLNGTALFGENVGFTGWGFGAIIGHNCDLDARKTAFNANLTLNAWVLETGSANFRRAVFGSCASVGAALNAGASAIVSEARFVDNQGDGLRTDANTTVYAEAPMFVGNGGMNVRLQDSGKVHLTDGVSFSAGASGMRFEGGSGRIDRMVIAANARAGVEGLDQAHIQGSNVWVTGTSNTAGSGNGIELASGSNFTGDFSTASKNEGSDVVLGSACFAALPNAVYDDFSGVSAANTLSVNGSALWDGNAAADTGSSTPIVAALVGSITAYTADLSWTRDKNRISFDATVTVSNKGTATGGFSFGLPFTAAASSACYAMNSTQGIALAAYVSGSTVFVYHYAGTGSFPVVANGDVVEISGTVRA